MIAYVPIFFGFLPLAALYYKGPLLGLGLLFAAGTLIFGLFSLFLAIVPSETVEVRYLATTLGMLLGMAEFSDLVVGPGLAEMVAGAWGVEEPLWILAGVSIPVSLLTLGIQEMAPRVLARRGGEGLSPQPWPSRLRHPLRAALRCGLEDHERS